MLADACKALCQDPSVKYLVCGRTSAIVYTVFPSPCAACQQGATIEADEECPVMPKSGKLRGTWPAHLLDLDLARSSHVAANNRPVATTTHSCAPGIEEVKCDVSICNNVECSEGLECYVDACGACKTGTASHMQYAHTGMYVSSSFLRLAFPAAFEC